MGAWGKNLIGEFSMLEEEGKCKLNIVVSLGNQDNKQWLDENYPSLAFSTDLDSVLKNPKIDSLVIATPTPTHFDLAKKAILVGKNVFVEKPPTQTLTELEQLIILAREQQVVLFTDHIYLYHPLIEKLKTRLEDHDVDSVRVNWLKWGSFKGNIFEELAYHQVYLTQKLFGLPSDVKLVEKRAVITQADIITFEMRVNNINCSIHINRVVPNVKHLSLLIHTKKGLFVWTDQKIEYIDLNNQDREVIEQSDQKPLPLVCKDFIKRISEKQIKNPDFQLMVETMKVIEQLKTA